MRILLITACIPFPPNKGEKIRTMAILEALSRIGSVDLVVISNEQSKIETDEILKKYCSKTSYFRLSRLTSYLKLFLGIFLHQSLTHSYFFSYQARKYLARLNYQQYNSIVIVSRNIYLNIPRKYLSNTLWDLIDLDSNKWYHRYKMSKNLLSKLFFYREYRLVKKVELAISRATKCCFVINQNEITKSLLHNHKINVKVLATALPDSYVRAEKTITNSNVIVFSGQMDYQPNIDAVMFLHQQIYPTLKERNSDLSVKIIGRNPSPSLTKLCKDFIFTGEVESSSEHINKASLYIIPIFEPIGMPTKILEAMACNVPIITTKIIGDLYELENGIHYLASNDATEFIENIARIFAEPTLANFLAENCFALLQERFSVDIITKELKMALNN